jgi:hypothetical protein
MANGLRGKLDKGIGMAGGINLPVRDSVMVNLTDTQGRGSISKRLNSGGSILINNNEGGVSGSFTSASGKSKLEAGQGVVAGDGIGARLRINF